MGFEFLNRFKHELINPLSNMKHLSDLLISEVADLEGCDDKYQPSITQLRKGVTLFAQQTTDLIDIVQDLSTLIRFELGTYPITPRTTNIASIIQEILHKHRHRSQKPITFSCETLPTIELYTDRGLFETMLNHLVANAYRYTDEGAIDVIVKAGDPISISITDTGKGINEAHISQIFEPYVRCHPGLSKGSGLGLTIVSKIIQKHQGEITVQSTEGKGSTFQICLPQKGIEVE